MENTIYLGEDGLQKGALAFARAAELLETNLTNLFTHPDFLLIASADSTIKVESATAIINHLSFTPVMAKKKVIVIKDAQYATQEFQQSILKFLEDGNVHCTFLITTTRNLLDTIHSRCVTRRVSRWNSSAMATFIHDRSLAEDTVALAVASGRPGVYEAVVNDSVFLSELKQLVQVFPKVNNPRNLFVTLGLLDDSWCENHTSDQLSLYIEFLEQCFLELMYYQVAAGTRSQFDFLDRKAASDGFSISVLLNIAEHCIDDRSVALKKGRYGKNEFFQFVRYVYTLLEAKSA